MSRNAEDLFARFSQSVLYKDLEKPGRTLLVSDYKPQRALRRERTQARRGQSQRGFSQRCPFGGETGELQVPDDYALAGLAPAL